MVVTRRHPAQPSSNNEARAARKSYLSQVLTSGIAAITAATAAIAASKSVSQKRRVSRRAAFLSHCWSHVSTKPRDGQGGTSSISNISSSFSVSIRRSLDRTPSGPSRTRAARQRVSSSGVGLPRKSVAIRVVSFESCGVLPIWLTSVARARARLQRRSGAPLERSRQVSRPAEPKAPELSGPVGGGLSLSLCSSSTSNLLTGPLFRIHIFIFF